MRLVGVLLLGLALSAAAQQQLVITNAKVWTADSERPTAEAVLVEGNRIAAVGTAAEIALLRKPGSREFNAGGRMVMPAFADAHLHFLSGSLGLSQVDLTGICTLESIQKAVADYARAHPDKAWITGRGWEYYCFPGQRLPTKEDLDAVVKDRPVFLTAYDGHTGWANSKALERADINRATGFEGYGEVVKDPRTGQPTGALKEGAQALVRKQIPAITRDEKLAALREGLKLAARLGISSIQNASGDEEELSLYEELLRRGELTLRVSFALSIPPEAPLTRPAEIARLKARYTHPQLQVRGVKLMIDGVIESYTAAMLAPYTDKPSESGSPAWTIPAFNAMVAACNKAGLQVYTHAIGDRGVRITLDAYQQFPNVRNRIEHIETIDPTDLPRFAKLGVLASLQPIHADPDTIHVWSERIGTRRVQLAFPWRSLEQAGARVVFSSDWPASISVNPIRGIHNAVNRRTTEGKPPGGWIPAQRVSLATALRGYTTNAAWAEFTEKEKGMIRPGMLADLIVLSQDLFTIDPINIHRTTVVCHVFDGRIIYNSASR
jgi:predicted amidohydrolase YtcJ